MPGSKTFAACAGLATLLPACCATAADIRMREGLTPIDYFMVVAYFATVLGIGWYQSRRQTNSEDYFIASKKHIHPVLIGISMFASLLSTISYLGKPGEIINKGPFLLVGQIIAVPFGYVVVGYVIIPRLMRERVTSAYELLESKLGIGVRLLGATLFICLRLVWMGLLIHLASIAIQTILGFSDASVPIISAVCGMVAVLYTSAGGFRTVVLADLCQFTLMLTGALVTIGLVTWHLGGISWFPHHWSPQWEKQPLFSFDPHVRVTMFTAALSMFVWRVCTAGGDQTAVQRYMATKDIKAARRSYLITELITFIVTIVLALLGLSLLGFFSQPGMLPEGMTIAKYGDRLFPLFIANHLPVGLSGLVVAALIASMSNVDSGVSGVSAVIVADFLERFGRAPQTEKGKLRLSRLMAFSIGVIVVTASMLMHHVPGNFVEMAMKTNNLFVSPIFLLFFMALWVSFATPLGAIIGCACSLATAILIGFWDVITGARAISFQLMGPGSLLVGIVVALAVSKLFPRRPAPEPQFEVASPAASTSL